MSSRRVLLVDDDPVILLLVEEMLGDSCDLVTASSGAEALEAVEARVPDLVLMDIQMPGMNGYEACRRMRERDALSATKIVLVSGEAMDRERLRDLAPGADDCVTKPFGFAELLDKIEELLAA